VEADATLALMENLSAGSKAVAIVQGQSFSILLDSGSRDANYVSARVAGDMSGSRYKCDMRVKTANGEVEKITEFLYLQIIIKLNEEIKFCEFLNFFIFPNLPVHFVIGRGTINKYKMYKIMEEIDTAELSGGDEWRETGEFEKEIEDIVDLSLLGEEEGSLVDETENELDRYIEKTKLELEEIIQREYADVFAKSPSKQPANVWEMKLKLVGEAITSPEGLSRVPRGLRGNGRTLPQRYVSAADSQIKAMLEQGVIEISTSPISIPIHLTPKPNTNPVEMRFCLDCKLVNTLIQRENFPMMGIPEFLGWMGSVRPEFFIKLDLTKMYFQLPLEQQSRLLTAFNWRAEKFQFTRVVMGMANSVGHAQNIMVNQVLAGLVMTVVFPYLDDCLIPGNRTTHPPIAALRSVLDRFRHANLVLNDGKCEIMVKSTIFLGHKISRHGVEISPKKKVDFVQVPRPVTTTNLRSFLALASYFRRFLPKFAETAACLYSVTGGSKQSKIIWTEERDSSFVKIKTMVQRAVVLKFLQDEGDVILFCDASKYGFGGGIFQNQGEIFEDKSVLTPIAFWGRAFEPHQVKWHTSDREMFAICFGILSFHHLLAGREFVVYTDHAALVSMRESDSEKINRMKEKLTVYNWTAKSIKGKENVIGDGMSRIFVDEDKVDGARDDGDIEEVIQAYNNQSLNLLSVTNTSYLPWIQYYHGERGHWSLRKTMELIRAEGKEWPGCEEMMKEYIDGCQACIVNEPRRQHFHGKQYSLSGNRPGNAWAIDLKEVGEGYSGHKYVLCIIDEFSRRVTLYPLLGKSAEEATYYIWHHIMDNGRPESVRYDPGREFNNSLLKGIVTFLGAQNIQTAAGDHGSNGIVERFIRELDEQLRRYFQNRSARTATDWIWYLPVIARNHNEMAHGTTGVPPNALHGDRFWGLAEEEREHLIEYVRTNIIKSKPLKQSRANGDELQEGVIVYIAVEDKEKRNLDATNWEGPFEIGRRRGDLIEVLERKGLEYHISRVKVAKKM